MPNNKKIPPPRQRDDARKWTFNPSRGGWELHQLPEVNPVNAASGCLVTHLGGIAVPTMSQYVLVAIGVVISLGLRHRLLQLIMACSNVVAVPVIVRWVPDGAEHLARIDYANLGPVLIMVACLAGTELLRVIYARWDWNLCLPVPLVPKGVQPA
jgi:hypothetical protein